MTTHTKPFHLRSIHLCLLFLLITTITKPQSSSSSSCHLLPTATALSKPPQPEVSMGTTILAVRYKDGVVVAADTRTSVSGYVSNRFASKLTFVLDRNVDCFDDLAFYRLDDGGNNQRENNDNNDNNNKKKNTPTTEASTCCICRSGSAADTQYLSNAVRSSLLSRQILHHTRGTVTNAARLLRSMLLDDPDKSAGLICAGYDHVLQRGVIYSINPGGALFELPEWAAGGSGSSFILGHLDARIVSPQEDVDMWEEEDAVDFVTKAVELAMERDGSSGGFVRLYVINRWGKREVVRLPRSAALSSVEEDIGGKGNGKDGEAPSLLENGRVAPFVPLKGFASPSKI